MKTRATPHLSILAWLLFALVTAQARAEDKVHSQSLSTVVG
jgi:hypothetical protein